MALKHLIIECHVHKTVIFEDLELSTPILAWIRTYPLNANPYHFDVRRGCYKLPRLEPNISDGTEVVICKMSAARMRIDQHDGFSDGWLKLLRRRAGVDVINVTNLFAQFWMTQI